jgi:hypothetical protein
METPYVMFSQRFCTLRQKYCSETGTKEWPLFYHTNESDQNIMTGVSGAPQ